MQALDVLAEEYEIFTETMRKVTHETDDVDVFAVAYETMQELDKAQKEQDELEATRDTTGHCLQGLSPVVGRIWIRPARKSTVGHSTMSRAPI